MPSPFPRSAFEAAVKLQPLLNELYARVALDKDFMTKVIGGNVTKVDDFTRRLWDIYDDVYVNSSHEDGPVSTRFVPLPADDEPNKRTEPLHVTPRKPCAAMAKGEKV